MNLMHIRVGDTVGIRGAGISGTITDRVRYVNPSMIETERGYRFSRKKGRSANKGRNEVVLLPEFKYHTGVAKTNVERLPSSVGGGGNAPTVGRVEQDKRWLSAMFKSAEWRRHTTQQGKRVFLSLRVWYSIIGQGRYKGANIYFDVQVVNSGQRVQGAEKAVQEFFLAEYFHPDETDALGADLCNEYLGRRPVRLHFPALARGQLGRPDNILATSDDFIAKFLVDYVRA